MVTKEVKRLDERSYKCSRALGLAQQGEGLAEYCRRAHYELDRVESVAEQHCRWHTHLDARSAECFICTLGYLARCYLRMLEQYGAIPNEDTTTAAGAEPIRLGEE